MELIVSTASLHHWTDVGAVIASLARVLRPDGRMWIYDIRWVPADGVRSASSGLGHRVERTLLRTGWFPAPLFQRLAIEPAGRPRYRFSPSGRAIDPLPQFRTSDEAG